MPARWIACCLLLAVACGKKSDSEKLTVAAAASLTEAYEAIGEAFTAKTGTEVRFIFGSSGNLARQLENGGPFDVYAAANVIYVDRVIEKGAALADSRTLYARGRVVAWRPEGKPALAELDDLRASQIETISLAKPDSAPYGRAAKQALEKVGLWSELEGRMVYGSNVRQALQHVETDNSDVALTALSLVIKRGGSYLLIDESMHDPLEQGIVVTKRGKKTDAATAFVAFVNSPEGHAILRKYGLLQAGESLAE